MGSVEHARETFISLCQASASGCPSGAEQELMAMNMAVAAPPFVTTDRRRPLLVAHATAAALCGPRLSVCTKPSGRCGIVLSVPAARVIDRHCQPTRVAHGGFCYFLLTVNLGVYRFLICTAIWIY